MKRKISILLLLVMFTIGANAQLLYKISGNGLQKPSYIVGTYHLAPAAFADSIKGIHEAVNNTNQVYGEIDMSLMEAPESMTKMMDAMMLPEGKTLQTILTKDQLSRLNTFLKNLMGADLSNPEVAQQMNKMTPQAIAQQLTVLMFLQKHMGQFDPTSLIDNYFQLVAKKNNEPVGGLETVDFQINTLFKGMTIERQTELLMCLVDNADYNEKLVEKTIDAFYAQDINKIKEVMDEKMGNSCDATPEEDAAIINNRNANWLTQMPAIMQAKPTLFAVGAAHLPGDKGMLSLLRNAGYTVEGMK
jgi:uncharacterized protein YbaP (TraB family)